MSEITDCLLTRDSKSLSAAWSGHGAVVFGKELESTLTGNSVLSKVIVEYLIKESDPSWQLPFLNGQVPSLFYTDFTGF